MDQPTSNTVQDYKKDNQHQDASVISMHEFLDFLKLTCQVNETLDNSGSGGGDDKKYVDYDQLAKNELVNMLLSKNRTTTSPSKSTKECTAGCGKLGVGENFTDKKGEKTLTKKRSIRRSREGSDAKPPLDPVLNQKLDEVINEGILDSVLPFICPSVTAPSSAAPVQHTCNNNKPKMSSTTLVLNGGAGAMSTTKPLDNTLKIMQDYPMGKKSDSNLLVPTASKDRFPRRKVSIQSSTSNASMAERSEVIIHVCDEVKGISKDYSCPQKLLVAKMGYFADVTAGQRLEDMDISVHCDLQIFEWLMRWMKRESVSQEMWPILDAANVVPILVSASFLQMEPLLLDCLAFCHSQLNGVVKASANLSCLNENIISRLAAMFTNAELEMVKDKKERVTPRLWTKMIQSLCEPESQSLRGHYASLADLFRCIRCCKYITNSVSSYIHCLPQHLRLNRWGQIVCQHVRDPAWNITNYVAVLYKEIRSWRKVYWRLWGNCHFLYCVACETHFPVYQMNWCPYHPDPPQFLGPITEGRMAGPAGRYPCCGQQAFRYESLPGPGGCQYREHTVQLESDRDRAIFKLVLAASEGECLTDVLPQPIASGNGTNEPWWNGVALTPHRDRQGLLPPLNVDLEYRVRSSKKLPTRPSVQMDSSSDTESSDNTKRHPMFKEYSISSDGCESDLSSPRPVKATRHRCPKRKIKLTGRHWSGDISARSNQDNQREFEEKTMKQVIAMVGKKTGSETNLQYQIYQQGGTYIRLENEWRESIKQKVTKSKFK